MVLMCHAVFAVAGKFPLTCTEYSRIGKLRLLLYSSRLSSRPFGTSHVLVFEFHPIPSVTSCPRVKL